MYLGSFGAWQIGPAMAPMLNPPQIAVERDQPSFAFDSQFARHAIHAVFEQGVQANSGSWPRRLAIL